LTARCDWIVPIPDDQDFPAQMSLEVVQKLDDLELLMLPA